MPATWPWLTIAGLGAYHGLNPAMGWLFALALGLHRQSRRAVLWALPPIAVGHALSVWLVAMLFALLRLVIAAEALRRSAGVALLLWAAYHLCYGHRRRISVGITAGSTGLALWSFWMATAHGAGLMVIPAMMPLCGALPRTGSASLLLSTAATGVHMLAMLAVTGFVAFAVYEWLGLVVLQRGWINFDALWTAALAVTGAILVAVG
jgi:hypothetical protein